MHLFILFFILMVSMPAYSANNTIIGDSIAPVEWPVPQDNKLIVTHIYDNKFLDTIVIAPNGNDANACTDKAPCKTLERVASMAKKQGTVIRMKAGTYILSKPIHIQPGVSLIGAGRDKTIIKPGSTFKTGYKRMISVAYTDKKGVVRGNQTFEDFKILGNYDAATGLSIGNENTRVNNIHIENMKQNGLKIGGKNIEVANSVFINNSGKDNIGDYQHPAGNIVLYTTNGVFVHHNVIRENAGIGIKGVHNHKRGIRIYNNDIETSHNVSHHNISIELWQLVGDNHVYNNKLTSWVSFVKQNVSYVVPGWNNLKFYNNTIKAIPGKTNVSSAVEISMAGVDMYNNHISGFKHRAFWMEGWKDPSTQNIRIWGNKLVDCGSVGMFGNSNRAIKNISIFNNTAVNCGGININKYAENVAVFNNLLLNAGGSPIRATGDSRKTPIKLSMKNNIVYNEGNIISSIDKTVFTMEDPKLDQNLAPKAGSPVIDKGIQIPSNLGWRSQDIAFSYEGKAPDIGAVEFKQPPAPQQDGHDITLKVQGTSYMGKPRLTVIVDNRKMKTVLIDAVKGSPKSQIVKLNNVRNNAKIKLLFDNDRYVKGSGDRNMYIQEITVNNKIFPLKTVNVVGRKPCNRLNSDHIQLNCNGYVEFYAKSPALPANTHKVEAMVFGSEFQGSPRLKVIINNKVYKTYVLQKSKQLLSVIIPKNAKASLLFDNDRYQKGVGDRNIYVENLTINGEKQKRVKLTGQKDSISTNQVISLNRNGSIVLDL